MKVLVACLALLPLIYCGATTTTTTTQTPAIEVRFLEPSRSGNTVYGYIVIRYNNEWGTICDDAFDMNDNGAIVLCRMAGYTGGSYSTSSIYETGDGKVNNKTRESLRIWLDEVRCRGTESSVDECGHNAWGTHDCNHHEDVGILCIDANTTTTTQTPAIDTTTTTTITTITTTTPPVIDTTTTTATTTQTPAIEVRFLEPSRSGNSVSGYIVIRYNNEWGTICNDYFHFNDNGAKVVCRMAGYTGGSHNSTYETGVGKVRESLKIWLDDVKCHGNESSIDQCLHNPWGSHNCDHTEDAKILCIDKNTTTTTTTQTPAIDTTTTTTTTTITSTPPPVSGLTKTDAVNKCNAIGWTVGYTTDKSLVCTAPGSSWHGNCQNCDYWRLLVWADGGTDQGTGGETYLTKAGKWYGGHSPCTSGWNLPECPSSTWNDEEPAKTTSQADTTTTTTTTTQTPAIEPDSPCKDNPCGPFGNCTVVVANDRTYGYDCQCQHGYSEDGKHCRDISNVTQGYTIDCHETYVVATWNKASFHNANQIQITLNLPSCNKHQENSTHLWIMTNFTQCGSRIVEDGDVMLQKNTAKITTTHKRNNYTIQQRKYSYKMECSFQRNRNVSTNLGYKVSDIVNVLVKKTLQTNFDTSMSFYHTSSFLQIISSPFTVTSFQPIYVGLTQGNNNFKIIVHQCFATPSASANGISDVFFHKKCPLDPTFRIISHSNTNFFFTINAFKFIEVNGGVYMHCRIRICKANSTSENCRQSCSMRKRRGIQDEHANQQNALTEIVVTSPKISFENNKCSNITCPLNSECIKTAKPAKCRCNKGYVYNFNLHLCSNERVLEVQNLPVDYSWLTDNNDADTSARGSFYEAAEAKIMTLFPTTIHLDGVKLIGVNKTGGKVSLDLLILYSLSSDKKHALEELTDAVKAAKPNKITG